METEKLADGDASPTLETSDSNGPIDPEAERGLLLKLDLMLWPVFFIIYMMAFLDRINISNAAIQGMTAELHLDEGNRFNVALFAYYSSYILLEIPSNMIIRKVRPSIYISTLMFIWGVINMCMGFVHSYATLVALRVLLGAFEAGVLPGIVYVSSLYYTRHEYQKRVSFFFCSTVVAGAFGGLLAYAIAGLSTPSMAAWRWIFIIEGAVTSALGIAASFVIANYPEQNRFLSAKEKDLIRRRLALDIGDLCRMDTLNKFALTRVVRDYKIWLAAFTYMGVSVAGLSGTFFLPTILLEFGWKAQEAQVRTIPVYVFAAGMMLLGAWASDRLRHRSGFIIGGASLATIGYSMLLAQEGRSRDYKFAAVFLVFGGAFMITPMCLAWLQNNVSGHWKRAFAASSQVTIGNFAGIIGAFVFIRAEAPGYRTGYSVALGMMWFGALCAATMAGLMWRENRKRDRGEREGRIELREEDRKNMGDWHPSFRFTL
ncbi:major facilitator superfamily domain-containing protein [Cercophora newfieldiana]|uniref:Major facilitator superfamily domain-containing protein n=1 Tax=Cercophora newfieldiana TaxID=92897 RepID=A0AA40CR41_9PEZI|nr:major facilitator superfamily domain-containing protein [Cercophora newfieldiana]